MTAPVAEPLTRRNGVELARTGRWALSTGEWNASPEDFASAVAAMACPAVRAPYIRIGHTDQRFGDGEPTVGRIENLRLADGGNTLVGDYADVPAWLNTVMASAYPDRSVEGTYNRRCQLGHVHPFVLDGLALLGVTRPGVGTLRPLSSLDDVKNLFAPINAAAGEVRIAASIPGGAFVTAADGGDDATDDGDDDDEPTGAMIALVPTAADAQRLAVDGGEPVDQLHLTLAYLGDAANMDPQRRQEITAAVMGGFAGLPPVTADAFAVSVFNPDGDPGDTCIVLGLSGGCLDDLREMVLDALAGTSLMLPEQHSPFIPHITLTYSKDYAQVAQLVDRIGPVTFDRLRIAFAGQNTDIPLVASSWDDAYGGGDVESAGDPYVPIAAAGASSVNTHTTDVGPARRLKAYWTDPGRPGAIKIRWGEKNDWYRCVAELGKYVKDPKGLCNVYHRAALGVAPGQEFKHTHASAHDREDAVPNPQPSRAEQITKAWNAKAPFSQYVVRVNASDVVVIDETDRSFLRVPVTIDGDTVQFGEPRRVMPDYVDYDEQRVAASVVYASRGESRPDVAAAGDMGMAGDKGSVSDKPWSQFTAADYTPEQWKNACLIVRGDGSNKGMCSLPVREPDGTLNRNAVHAAAGAHGVAAVKGLSDADRKTAAKKLVSLYGQLKEDPPDSLKKLAGVNAAAADPPDPSTPPDPGPGAPVPPQTPPAPGGVPVSPAAEPEPTTDPKEEDLVSTLSTDVRSRLGLTDDADDTATLAALDELKSKADAPSAPDPELVAASAATEAERDELRKEVKVLASKMEAVTAELAATKAEKAATVKASVLDAARDEGKFAPADYEQWAKDYDDAPAAVTRILASIAPGTAVPVNVKGHTGSIEAAVTDVDTDLANGWGAQLGISTEVLTRD